MYLVWEGRGKKFLSKSIVYWIVIAQMFPTQDIPYLLLELTLYYSYNLDLLPNWRQTPEDNNNNKFIEIRTCTHLHMKNTYPLHKKYIEQFILVPNKYTIHEISRGVLRVSTLVRNCFLPSSQSPAKA